MFVKGDGIEYNPVVIPFAGSYPGGLVYGCRQYKTIVVIGMLTYEVDTARRFSHCHSGLYKTFESGEVEGVMFHSVLM